MDLKEAGLIEGEIGAHWYYRAKLTALRRMLPEPGPTSILDVGAGLGFFSSALLMTTGARTATCVDPGYPESRDEVCVGKHLAFRGAVDQSDADLVLMMDVLEHVEDDAGLVREYADKVAYGTRFIVTVPAFMWLWSGHDVFLAHFRRYTLAGIEDALRSAGLTVNRGCYFYAPLLPLVALTRRAERWRRSGNGAARSAMRAFGPAQNAILWQICRAELPLFRANRVAGLTAFVLATKERHEAEPARAQPDRALAAAESKVLVAA